MSTVNLQASEAVEIVSLLIAMSSEVSMIPMYVELPEDELEDLKTLQIQSEKWVRRLSPLPTLLIESD